MADGSSTREISGMVCPRPPWGGGEWPPLAASLAAQLSVAGYVTSTALRDAVEAIPRHRLLPVDEPSTNHEWWLELLYADMDMSDVLTVRALAGPVDRGVSGAVLAPRAGWCPAPHVLAWLLELVVPPRGVDAAATTATTTAATRTAAAGVVGPRVLVVEAGCGYPVALLCHMLGDELVTATDPHRADQIRAELAELGLHPCVVSALGALGAVTYGPYDVVLSLSATSAGPVPDVVAETLRMVLDAGGGRVVAAARDGEDRITARVDELDAAGQVRTRTLTPHGVMDTHRGHSGTSGDGAAGGEGGCGGAFR